MLVIGVIYKFPLDNFHQQHTSTVLTIERDANKISMIDNRQQWAD